MRKKEDKWEWNLCWRRQWFKWEKSQIQLFMQDIERINLDRSHQDTWEWVDGHDKVYTVKLAYAKMQSSLIGEQSVVFDSLLHLHFI